MVLQMFAAGEHPAVKLAEAHEQSRQARKHVAEGVSPAQALQLDKNSKINCSSNTFALIGKEWL